MKNILFTFLFLPFLAPAQIYPPLPDDVTVTDVPARSDTIRWEVKTIPLKVTGDGTPTNPHRVAPDTSSRPYYPGLEVEHEYGDRYPAPRANPDEYYLPWKDHKRPASQDSVSIRLPVSHPSDSISADTTLLGDVSFSPPFITFGEAFACQAYRSDTTVISLCSNGDITIKKIRWTYPIDSFSVDRQRDTTLFFDFDVRTMVTISELRLKDTTGLLFKTIEANNRRMYEELDELRVKVQIYEAYYGIIKGQPYQDGDCIELLPPRYPRTPCEPKVKAPAKKKTVHPAKRT